MKKFLEISYDNSGMFPYKPLTENILFSNNPISKITIDNSKDKYFIENKNKYNYIDNKEINLYGYRCDNFKKIHNEKHILFTGCSYTFGDGLIKNEVWAKRLYDNINSKEKCSGYFNLGISASSILTQVVDLFKYFKTFSNPDIIFFNLTDLNRMYTYDLNKKTFFDGIYNEKYFNLLKILSYQYYFMLNQYCLVNNIKLYSFSWTSLNPNMQDNVSFFIKYFENFYNDDINLATQYIIDYKKNNKNDMYHSIARDKIHLGNAYHYYWSEIMYERYMKLK